MTTTEERTLTQRAVDRVDDVIAPSHLGKGAQLGGIALILLVVWNGILPGIHVLIHPGESGIPTPSLWVTLVFLAAAIVLLAGAETLAAFIRAIGELIPTGKRGEG